MGMMDAAETVQRGIPLPPALDRALLHSASVGGARPKALIAHGDAKHIAKFSSATDTHNVMKAEYVAMRLAREAGLDRGGLLPRPPPDGFPVLLGAFGGLPP